MIQHPFLVQIAALEPARRVGFVRKVARGYVEASGPLATVGDICEITTRADSNKNNPLMVLAEVAAVEDAHIVLVPMDQTASILPDARVTLRPFKNLGPVGEAFAGRAINALAEPIDSGSPILPEAMYALEGSVMQPMARLDSGTALETGIRAIDGMLTLGCGQRIGIFAASGVGKTTLVRQLGAQTICDHCILCLVGERGREVEAIWRDFAQRDDRAKYTCVAATSDASAALRVRAVHQALCLAEHWRTVGRHVVLIIDSVTRYAMALREIGLAAGAPPTLRAYTPNVFAALPRLVERCGAAKAAGSITAIVTVLSETDDVDDPIVEIMKSLLDGHIVLSRQLAEQGQFPAIDIPRSISRQAQQLMSPPHAAASRRAVAILAAYEEARMMIESGLYKAGASSRIDEAIRMRAEVLTFLGQESDECAPFAETLKRMLSSFGGR